MKKETNKVPLRCRTSCGRGRWEGEGELRDGNTSKGEEGGEHGRGWIFNLQAPVPLRADISLIAPPRTGDRSLVLLDRE